MLNLLGKRVTLVDVPPSDDNWYAHLLWFDRRKCLLLAHAGTLFRNRPRTSPRTNTSGSPSPGLAEGQRLVARDEARHIAIGVSYTRRRLQQDPEGARKVIGAAIDDFVQVATTMLATANTEMAKLVRSGYPP